MFIRASGNIALAAAVNSASLALNISTWVRLSNLTHDDDILVVVSWTDFAIARTGSR